MVYFEQDGDFLSCVTDKRRKGMIKTKHEIAALGERKLGTPTTVSRNCTPIKVLTFEHINEAEVARMDAKPHKLDLLFLSEACVL